MKCSLETLRKHVEDCFTGHGKQLDMHTEEIASIVFEISKEAQKLIDPFNLHKTSEGLETERMVTIVSSVSRLTNVLEAVSPSEALELSVPLGKLEQKTFNQMKSELLDDLSSLKTAAEQVLHHLDTSELKLGNSLYVEIRNQFVYSVIRSFYKTSDFIPDIGFSSRNTTYSKPFAKLVVEVLTGDVSPDDQKWIYDEYRRSKSLINKGENL